MNKYVILYLIDRSSERSSFEEVPAQSLVLKKDQETPHVGSSRDDVPDHLAEKPSDLKSAPESTQPEDNQAKSHNVLDLNNSEMATGADTPATTEPEEPSLVFESMPEPTYEYPIGPEENVITDGKVDLEKVHPIMFDTVALCYREIGVNVGGAWNAGKKFSE